MRDNNQLTVTLTDDEVLTLQLLAIQCEQVMLGSHYREMDEIKERDLLNKLVAGVKESK